MAALLGRPLTWGAVILALAMALVMPFGYLGAFLDLEGNTHDIPIVIVSEDTGATVNGQQTNLGQQVVAKVTAPKPPLGDTVKWIKVKTRADAVNKLRDNKAFAGIVLPKDYSAKVASLLKPSSKGPAQIEVLTNPAAGSYAFAQAQAITSGVVTSVSQTVAQQLNQQLTAVNATMPPRMAPVLANPVRAQPTEIVGVGPHSARGLGPFYLAVMLTLAGLIGTDIVNVGLDFVAGIGELGSLVEKIRGRIVTASPFRLWVAKLVATLVMVILAALIQTWVALGALSMPHTSESWRIFLFGVLCAAATALPTLALLTAFGTIGLLFAILLTTIFGVPSSGGPYPFQMLPDFFDFLGSWLPLRYETDGMRSLVFFGGRAAAGLGTALWVLGAWAIGSIIAGGVIAWGFDRRRQTAEGRRQLAVAGSGGE